MMSFYRCLSSMANTGAAEDVHKAGRLWWSPFRASSLTKDAAGGQARSPSLLGVNGLFVQAQVLLEPVPHARRRKGGSLPF